MGSGGVLRRILRRIRARNGEGTPLEDDHVVWAYRLLLDRDPESDAVIREKRSAWRTVRELRLDLLSSEEVRLHNEAFARAIEPQIVIKEIHDGLRLFIDLSDVAIGTKILRGRYEQSELGFVRKTIGPGQTVVDVG